MNDKSNPLTSLVGEQLSSVEFVQDYVQLHFDGPTLTAILLPSVMNGRTVFQPETPGYRDVLCALIARKVTNVRLQEGEELRIDFEDNHSVIISLRSEDNIGPETVIFRLRPENIWVW